MNNMMNNKEYFDMLLKNFRLSEAEGFIAGLVNMEKLPVKRGEECERLLGDYKRIISNSLWNEEGILILKLGADSNDVSKDIMKERDRLIQIIVEWSKSEKYLLLYYTSAYYALVDEDRIHLKICLEKILKDIGEQIDTKGISETLGGYQKFQYIGNTLEKYCNLKGSILEAIDELCIKLNLSESLSKAI